MFGPHLLVCGYEADKEALSSLETVYNLIDWLPDLVDMTKITQTQAFRYQGKVPEDWGITAMVMIAESHISIHTFPDKQFFAFDLFSCREFDSSKVVEELMRVFKVERINMGVDLLHRGQFFKRTSD